MTYAPTNTFIPFTDAPDSEVLDPEFCAELRAMSRNYDNNQTNVDDDQWNIARKVNEMWPEHIGMKEAFPTKAEYQAECSRVANIGLRHKRFSDSGETLRRWCETQATYQAFTDQVQDADKFLDLLSFDHLYKAKTLFLNKKVKSPFEALLKAITEGYTADEMQFHFDPPQVPDDYTVMIGRLDALQDKSKWSWLKSAETLKGVLFHAAEIKRLISEDK